MEDDESFRSLTRSQKVRLAMLPVICMLPMVGFPMLMHAHPGWALGMSVGFAAVAIVATMIVGRRAAARSGAVPIDGRCPCGYDLQGAPPRSESRHEFDVHGRMDAIKRAIVCPECGRDFVIWSDAPPPDDV